MDSVDHRKIHGTEGRSAALPHAPSRSVVSPIPRTASGLELSLEQIASTIGARPPPPPTDYLSSRKEADTP